MVQHIYGNIITDPKLFHNISPDILIPLTRFIAKNIDLKTHIPDVEAVVIIPSKNSVSRCRWLPSPNGGNGRFHTIEIYIDHPDVLTRALQWIQVVAHEYMHHAIDRKEKHDAPHPLVWFDETLCHISSVCIADDLFCDIQYNKTTELQWFRDYKSYLVKITQYPTQIARHNPVANLVAKSIQNGKGIREFLPFPEEGLDLALYSIAIASCAQNLFRENPNLWRIVPHVNEIPLDADINCLFHHLTRTADQSYRKSLDELINLLLPC